MSASNRWKNRRLTDEIVLDVGEDDKIVGIEIPDASKHVSLQGILPTRYEVTKMNVFSWALSCSP